MHVVRPQCGIVYIDKMNVLILIGKTFLSQSDLIRPAFARMDDTADNHRESCILLIASLLHEILANV